MPTDPNDPTQIQQFAQTVSRPRGKAVLVDVMREWIPLVVTLLYESERQRLVANVDPLVWTNQAQAASLPKSPPDHEKDKQLERHEKALQPKLHSDGITENNYQRAARLLQDCGYLSSRGHSALDTAFDIDRESQALNKRAPGAGGFLIKFALQLQGAKDTSDHVTKTLNELGSIYDSTTDNDAFEEIVGSHSLMSKDTLESSPFFDDAKVMASVASQSVLHILLDEVSSPPRDTALDWRKILRTFIRFPTTSVGWERRAMAFFREEQRNVIPKFADLPELARLPERARIPVAALEQQRLEQQRNGSKAAQLEEEYIKLEKTLSEYRRP